MKKKKDKIGQKEFEREVGHSWYTDFELEEF